MGTDPQIVRARSFPFGNADSVIQGANESLACVGHVVGRAWGFELRHDRAGREQKQADGKVDHLSVVKSQSWHFSVVALLAIPGH